ncbi:hypothetical protein BCR35DRAFT_310879 [Leucosporidium creatinivorum]|uniref:Uncharacterized protein n=1 Tax=Leucosporidium creatinivorum TaxID=106004 RepID=A0A1Y2CLV1_9BASI|nr:hypothetical protein BCR35DRAFT_310879 [Leucosporidium creatinivorum]
MDDAPDDLDLEPTIFPPSAAPLASAPAPASYAFSPPRRRMMGPREPGSAPPAARRAPTGPDPSLSSSATKPFERDHSPQPLVPMGYAPTLPLRTQSQSRSTFTPAGLLQPTPSPSPARTSTLPSPASITELPNSATSSNATKRPLIASPRATPSKKVASLAMAWEQRDGGSPASSPHPRRPSPSQPLRSTNRVASNSSSAHAPRSGRRVASGTSTIRGISPPPKPRLAEEMDVFDDLRAVGEQSRKEEIQEVVMDEDEMALAPIDKLRKHVQSLRAQLALDIGGKENERIVSPSLLSRSPHTRNVSLKALTNPSSSFASTYSEARKSSSTVDLPALVRWVDTINDLLASLEASNWAPQASPTKGPSDVEFAVLEQERDLLAAEVGALKEELGQVRTVSSPS